MTRKIYEYEADVLTVTDGDTLRCSTNLGFRIYAHFKFRIEGFDAPEIFSPRSDSERMHGLEAKAYAESLLVGQKVLIRTYKDPGAYNRYSADITLADGRKFAAVMIKEGFQKKESYENID